MGGMGKSRAVRNQAERMGSHVNDGYIQSELSRSDDFVESHMERAVAGKQNRLLAAAHARADRRAHAVSHGSETAAGYEFARAFEFVSLSNPHLVLTDVRSEYLFRIAETLNCFDYASRAELSVRSDQEVMSLAVTAFTDPRRISL